MARIDFINPGVPISKETGKSTETKKSGDADFGSMFQNQINEKEPQVSGKGKQDSVQKEEKPLSDKKDEDVSVSGKEEEIPAEVIFQLQDSLKPMIVSDEVVPAMLDQNAGENSEVTEAVETIDIPEQTVPVNQNVPKNQTVLLPEQEKQPEPAANQDIEVREAVSAALGNENAVRQKGEKPVKEAKSVSLNEGKPAEEGKPVSEGKVVNEGKPVREEHTFELQTGKENVFAEPAAQNSQGSQKDKDDNSGMQKEQFSESAPIYQGQIGSQNTEPLWEQTSAAKTTDTAAVRTTPETFGTDVGRTLAARMPEKDGTLTIELEPASLGKLTIRVIYEGGKAAVSIAASNPRALELLNQNAAEIARILEEKTGQQTVIYTPEAEQQTGEEQENPERRQQGREQEQSEQKQQSDSFAQQLRLGLV